MPQDRLQLPPAQLLEALRAAGHLAGGEAFSTLGGGRSNDVWLVRSPGPQGGNNVLKLFRSGPDNPLFANDAAREILCLKELGPTGLAPVQLAAGRGETGDWILYRHIAGDAWQTNTRRVAGLLSTLHRTSAPEGLPLGPSGSEALARQTHQILGRCSDGGRIAAARPVGLVRPAQRTCLIHCDPVPGNIVVTGTGMVLIDWQCPKRGDPCEDLALFLSPAMQSVYRGAPLSARETADFLEAYSDRATVRRYRALRPWFHWRMAAYCLWQAERGVEDYRGGLHLELAALNETRG